VLSDNELSSHTEVPAVGVAVVQSLHTRKKSGLRGQLHSGFSAHVPQCGLYGHVLDAYTATPTEAHKATVREAPLATFKWLVWPLFYEA